MKVLLLLPFLQYCGALNFLVYIPMFARSHVNFMGKVADTLIDGGHKVTVLVPVIESQLGTYGTKKAKVIEVPQCEYARNHEMNVKEHFANNFWKSSGGFSFMKDITQIFGLYRAQCNATIQHPGLLQRLQEERFDAAITEVMDHCGMGIFEQLGIEKTALAISLSCFEGSFPFTGLPSFPSYVPGAMSNFGEKMTFLERVQNTLYLLGMKVLIPIMNDPFTELFRQNFGQNFPSADELLTKSSLLFVNSDPLIEFPRPIIHKVIDVGGISVSDGHRPLNKTWSDIFNLRKKTVLLSFGTMASSYLMPQEYKNNIRETIRKFPDVTFIWKYEKPEHNISEGIPNLIESTFVPQNDMLYDRRLSLFITHCGQGSTTEATTAGVPLIVIPIMADQRRNSQVIKRIGTGIVLDKNMLDGTNELEKAIRKMFSDNTYAERAKITGQMIRDKPFTPRDTFVKNMEFLAKYGPLRQLDHYGKELNFFQYYLIDVFAFLTGIVFLSITILSFVVIRIIRCFIRPAKAKSD